MSHREPIRNLAVDRLCDLLANAREGHGSFFTYAAVYKGYTPDPCQSPAFFVSLGTETLGERSAGLANDAVVSRFLPVTIEARQLVVLQSDFNPLTVAGRMIADVERLIPGEHELAGTTMNVTVGENVVQITAGETEIEIVVGVKVELMYQTRLTDPTKDA